MNIKNRILSLKRWHSILSSMIFISLLFFCSYFANVKLTEISLSEFGINESTGSIWNSFLFIIGILLYVESIKNVIKFFGDFNWLILIFTFSISCLLLTSIIDMRYWIHNYTAFLYFLGFSSSIFLFGLKLIKLHFRIGITSIVISILSVLVPTYAVYILDGLAIPEITHTMFILSWIIVMSYDIEYQIFLKRIGL